MKKLLVVILSLLLLGSIAMAESIDWASMTDEEITALIEAGQDELKRRNPVDENSLEGFILIDDENVLCYLTGEYTIYGGPDEGYFDIGFDAIVENNSDKTVNINVDNCSVNGWEVYGGGVNDTGAGKKQKFELSIYLDEANVESIDDIEEIELSMDMTSDDFIVFWRGEPMILPPVK